MLNIESSAFLGSGKHRECYIHPHDKNLCVKIFFPFVSGRSLLEAKREIDYYHLMSRRGVPWTMLPAFHGEVMTNRGKGCVFDLIRDYNGEVSNTLEYYLSNQQSISNHVLTLSRALDLLKEYMLHWKVITMNIEAKNLIYQKTGANEGRLVIIDNVGNSDLIPLCNYIAFFARMKIRRKWRRFESSLLKEFPDIEFLQKKFQHTQS